MSINGKSVDEFVSEVLENPTLLVTLSNDHYRIVADDENAVLWFKVDANLKNPAQTVGKRIVDGFLSRGWRVSTPIDGPDALRFKVMRKYTESELVELASK